MHSEIKHLLKAVGFYHADLTITLFPERNLLQHMASYAIYIFNSPGIPPRPMLFCASRGHRRNAVPCNRLSGASQCRRVGRVNFAGLELSSPPYLEP